MLDKKNIVLQESSLIRHSVMSIDAQYYEFIKSTARDLMENNGKKLP